MTLSSLMLLRPSPFRSEINTNTLKTTKNCIKKKTGGKAEGCGQGGPCRRPAPRQRTPSDHTSRFRCEMGKHEARRPLGGDG